MIDPADIKISRSKRKTLSLHLLPDGTVEVRAPHFFPGFLINDFIKRNSGWIEKRIGIVKKHTPAGSKKYLEGEKISYLGNEYILTFGNYTSIKIEDDKLLFPKALEFRAKKELENWYMKQARQIITAYAEEIAGEMKTSFVSITLSDTRSQWGRCTRDNRLQFNWKLVMAPLLVLRYVVVHEIAHTLEKNHSHKFWSRVVVFNPSYRQQVKWLKIHGNGLAI